MIGPVKPVFGVSHAKRRKEKALTKMGGDWDEEEIDPQGAVFGLTFEGDRDDAAGLPQKTIWMVCFGPGSRR